MKKPVIKKEIIFIVCICLTWLMTPACTLINDYLGNHEFVICEGAYQSDFENIRSVIEKNGNGMYHMHTNDYKLCKIYHTGENRENIVITEIPLTDAEKDSVFNIVSYTHRMGDIAITDITAWDDYIIFFDERSGCGVMYTEDIESSIEIYNRGTDRFSYNWLSPGWYKIDTRFTW